MATKRDAIRLLTVNGWRQTPNKSTSHRKYRHPDKTGFVTLSVKRLNETMTHSAWHGFIKQMKGER